jgi:hypothetical protein
MSATLSRRVLALAVRSLGTRRRAWGQAMQAEFDEAEADGQSLRFALGCLLTAWRTMPDHAEGRYVLASHALALVVLLPMGTLLATAALSGFPIVEASDGAVGFLRGSGTFRLLLDPGTQCLGPAMLLLVLLLAGCHALMAWWLLERDWRRIGTATCFCAAVMVSLMILMACAALHLGELTQPLAGLAVECGALAALASWHGQGFGGVTDSDPETEA